MLINHSFQVDQPIDQVWNFFDDVPLVAACVPGADLTKEVGEDQYEGDVTISAGPVKLEFSGELKIKSRDNTKKVIVLEGAGADKKGRGAAKPIVGDDPFSFSFCPHFCELFFIMTGKATSELSGCSSAGTANSLVLGPARKQL